jgi:hypothetical protein
VVEVQRGDRTWIAIGIGDLDGLFTQGRTLAEIRERMIPDAIATLKNIAEDSFKVEVRVRVPNFDAAIEGVKKTRAVAEEAQRQVQEDMTELVGRLRRDGMGVRDIAELLGVSYQRISQLAHGKAS